VILSSKCLDAAKIKADHAEKKHGLSIENSQAMKILDKAYEKKSQGDLVEAEALAWKGEKILDDEIRAERVLNSCKILVQYSEEMLDHLEDSDIDISGIKEEIKMSEEALRQKDHDRYLSITAEIFAQVVTLIKTNDFKADYLRNIEELRSDIRSLKTKPWMVYIGFEKEKLKKKIEYLDNKEDLELGRVKEVMKKIRIDTSKKDFINNLRRLAWIDSFLIQLHLNSEAREREISTSGIDESSLAPKIEENLVEQECKKSEVLKSFDRSPRIKVDHLDFSSKKLVLFYPSVPKVYQNDIDGKCSYLLWNGYSIHDFEVIMDGLKEYDDLIGLDTIILIKMVGSEIPEDVVIFSNTSKEKIARSFTSQIIKRSYIDESNDFESLLYWQLSRVTDCDIYDITLNHNFKDSKLLFENITI